MNSKHVLWIPFVSIFLCCFSCTTAGVWARSPYLHNGSVRTMQELFTPPAAREKAFHRGSRTYDAAQMGYTDEGAYLFDTTASGNSNAGHNHGTDLSSDQKRELIEYRVSRDALSRGDSFRARIFERPVSDQFFHGIAIIEEIVRPAVVVGNRR